MRLILTGRPGKIYKRRDLFMTTMLYEAQPPELPPGVPVPPAAPIPFAVYMNARQYNKVSRFLRYDPEEQLYLDGNCEYDPGLQMMAYYVMHITTLTKVTRDQEKVVAQREEIKEKQRLNREKQIAEARAAKAAKQAAMQAAGGEAAPKEKPQPKPKKEKAAPAAAPAKAPKAPANILPDAPLKLPVMSDAHVPQTASPADAKKLSSLYAAAELYRQKIATIEAKPANQRFGLEMMQKLLKNTEDEIANLEKKYN